MRLFKLTKVVLSVSHNAEKFLNGITSNTLDQPKNAFLDVHGRIIATCDQIRVGEDRHLIVIEEKYLSNLMQHLERFIMLSRAKVSKENYQVYFDLDGEYQRTSEDLLIPQKSGQLVITALDLPGNVTKEEFALFRLKNNIPVHGIDYKDEMILNVSEDEFVSYAKGCFLGQEFVAKVHNRSKPTWKLVVRTESALSAEEKPKMTSKVFDVEKQETIGFVFVKNH